MVRRRILFAKTGRLRFISHLEIGRLLTRILRMGGWPLAFSAGHNPLPRIAYGPPLPLGVEGERELFDVRLVDAWSDDLLLAANRCAPEGLVFLSAATIPAGSPSLAAAAVTAEHRVRVPSDLVARARIEGRIEAFAAAGHVPLLKASKGRQRTVDLKRCVTQLGWRQPGQEAPDLHLTLLLQEPGGHVAGPFPVLREVFKWCEEDLARCLTVRERLLDAGGRPLDAGGRPLDAR